MSGTVPTVAGRVVIVIGASSGVGRSCARMFAERGDHLVLASRSLMKLDAVAEDCRARGATDVLILPTDVVDEDAVARLVDDTIERHGRIDVVVFSAGVMAYGQIDEVPQGVFTRVVDTAIHGTANVARAIMPVYRRQEAGTLIVITSLLASIPLPDMGAYITGKWGQLGLTRCLQLETRDEPGIEVCTISPGAVDTPIYRAAANVTGFVGQPPPPVVKAEDVAEAVMRSVDRPRKDTNVGPANRFITFGFRLVPKVFDVLAGPLQRLVALGDERVDPTDGNIYDPDATPSPDAPKAERDSALKR